jgi:conjugative transfer region protein (TIGR03750 family)
VTFLPHRLNRQPVIVRGLTADELWITVGLSAACGLALGIVLAILFGSFPLAPTMAVAFIAIGLFAGGGLLRRLKRGRPDTWLYRQMQCRLAQRIPAMSGYVGASELITRSGVWTIRRTRRP